MKNPKYPDESNLEFIDVACNKCYNCLVNRRESWLFRLTEESLSSVQTEFVTLTYSDEYCDSKLHRKHLCDFHKRLRSIGLSYTHYSIGEFGTTTFRPHYHFIAFLKEPCSNFNQLVADKWSFGNVAVYPAHTSALNYVLHYHVRPKFPFGDSSRLDKALRPFAVCSKRLGLSKLFVFDTFCSPETGRSQVRVTVRPEIAALLKTDNRLVQDIYSRYFILPRYYVKKAKEFGVEVKDYDGVSDPTSSAAREVFTRMFPDAKWSKVDSHPLNYSDTQFAQIMHDVLQESARKISRYNYQTKTSV